MNLQQEKKTYFFILLSIITLIFFSCTGQQDQNQQQESNTEKGLEPVPQELILQGNNLSRQYCVQCHLYTPPDLLPKHIWKNEVLPKMGNYHGFYQQKKREELIEKGIAGAKVLQRNVYPEQPTLDSAEWQTIQAFYFAKAPEILETASTDDLPVKNIFQPVFPKGRIVPPMTTMVDFKEASELIYHSDVKKDVSVLNIYQPSGKLIQAIAMRSAAAKIDEKEDGLWVLNMGKFTSTDAPVGSLSRISKRGGASQYNSVEVMIDSLQRPVDVDYADFDQDGDEDVVIAQFGNWAGILEWFENKGDKQYERHTLIPITGAEEVMVDDLNTDGLPDILAMIAQGEESIFACINQGNGRFQIRKILQVPPTHGSVTFEYLDLNSDGIKDILHVTGDNADYEAIPKPYHGLRIYLGRGNLEFEEPVFLPQNGAYKAIPADFDQDGDLDIASISFFPDYSGQAKESILIFENVSVGDKLTFAPFTLEGYKSGRWITMDSGDFNEDGYPDLVIGSFVVQNPYGNQSGIKKEWMEHSPMFVILINQWK